MSNKSYFYFALRTTDPTIMRSDFDGSLNIQPTFYRQMNPSGSIPKQTSWRVKPDNIESPILPEDIDRFLAVIQLHEKEITRLTAQFPSINPSLTFVLVVTGKKTTDAPDLSVEAVRFLARINAKAEFDIYWE